MKLQEPLKSKENIGALFFEVAGTHRNKVALREEGATTTYDQLAIKVRAWQKALQDCRAQPGERIIVAPGEIPDRVAALLAALSEGLIYVIAENWWDQSRWAQITEDCSPSLHAFPGKNSEPRVCRRKQASGTAPEPLFDRKDARACLFYTSGSSGSPKAVIQTHKNILNEAVVHQQTLNLTCEDRLTGLYPLSAAGSTRDVFASLLLGAEYVPIEMPQQPWSYLEHRLLKDEPTIFHSVPPLFRAWSDHLDLQQNFPSVRTIFLAGDTVLAKDARNGRNIFPKAAFYTGLGCTETSSLYVHFLIPPSEPIPDPLPSGKAVPGRLIQIVDPQTGSPVKVGQPGQIVVESEFLTEGYWNRSVDKQTDFLCQQTKLLFRTDDTGFINQQGLLYHTGRLDRRVKINGALVDLLPLEQQIARCSGVREAKVITSPDSLGNTYLTAFILRDSKNWAGEKHLRRELADLGGSPSLRICPVPRFPLQSSGKIDQEGLRKYLTAQNNQAFDPKAPPKEDAYEKIASAFSYILGHRIDDYDADFRVLGGDSLGIIQLLSELERRLGQRVQPHLLNGHFSVNSCFAAYGQPSQSSAYTNSSGWPSLWFHEAAKWKLPDNVQRSGDFPGYILPTPMSSEDHSKERPVLVWLVSGSRDYREPLQFAGKLHVYALPSGLGIAPTGREAIELWLPQVAQNLQKALGEKTPVVLGGFCGSAVLATSWANELSKRGTPVQGIFALDAPGSARLGNLWSLAALSWQQLFREMKTVSPARIAPMLRRKIRSLQERLGIIRKQDRTPQSKTLKAYRFSLNDPPAWPGIIFLAMSKQAWRWRFLLGPDFGWPKDSFPKVHLHRARGSHRDFFSANDLPELFEIFTRQVEKSNDDVRPSE